MEALKKTPPPSAHGASAGQKRPRTVCKSKPCPVSRAVRNRQAALTSRERKRAYVLELEAARAALLQDSHRSRHRIGLLEAENSALRAELDALRGDFAHLRELLTSSAPPTSAAADANQSRGLWGRAGHFACSPIERDASHGSAPAAGSCHPAERSPPTSLPERLFLAPRAGTEELPDQLHPHRPAPRTRLRTRTSCTALHPRLLRLTWTSCRQAKTASWTCGSVRRRTTFTARPAPPQSPRQGTAAPSGRRRAAGSATQASTRRCT